MIKCFAIYPHHISEEYIKKVKKTIDLAVKYKFNEVFTSIHLPEYSLEEQLESFKIIGSYAKLNNLEVTVDIGGHFIDEVLSDEEALFILKNIPFDFVRLDYGYSIEQCKSLYDKLNFKGFVINASIYNEQEVDNQVKNLKEIDNNIKIRACHNYYVRQESGLEETFAIKQDSYFTKYDIPIYYCVPTYSNPRGPLCDGLCTIERHRHKTIADIITDLYINYGLKAFMMADEWLSEDEFKQVEEILDKLTSPLNKIEDIEVKFMNNVSEEEKNIVLKKHEFRYDSSSYFLRSQSSRQMAEFAHKIKKNRLEKRVVGSITIDNELYKRYSGELQVVIKECNGDEKVNVVAKVCNRDDIVKLLRFREGIIYNFVEAKNED